MQLPPSTFNTTPMSLTDEACNAQPRMPRKPKTERGTQPRMGRLTPRIRPCHNRSFENQLQPVQQVPQPEQLHQGLSLQHGPAGWTPGRRFHRRPGVPNTCPNIESISCGVGNGANLKQVMAHLKKANSVYMGACTRIHGTVRKRGMKKGKESDFSLANTVQVHPKSSASRSVIA